MPSFNRRGFLQLLGAAGVAPLLPALPVRAVTATAGGSVSKALWAGIYAKSGSAPKFVSTARNMGLSNAAIQGVSARSVGVRVALATVTNPITRTLGAGNATTSSSFSAQSEKLKASRNILRDVERAISVKTDETAAKGEQDMETIDPASKPNEPKNGTH